MQSARFATRQDCQSIQRILGCCSVPGHSKLLNCSDKLCAAVRPSTHPSTHPLARLLVRPVCVFENLACGIMCGQDIITSGLDLGITPGHKIHQTLAFIHNNDIAPLWEDISRAQAPKDDSSMLFGGDGSIPTDLARGVGGGSPPPLSRI